MRVINRDGASIVPTSTGEREVCPGCQSELYSRSLPDTINEFTWVHTEAGDCSLSYDREYETYKSSRHSRRSTNHSMPSNKQKNKRLQQESEQRLELLKQVNEEKLKYLKQKVEEDGTLAKAHECILHAISFKQQASISGILGGLKKDLISFGISEGELKNLNKMASKKFYLSQHA